MSVPTGGLYLFLGSDRSRKRQRIHALATALAVHLFDHHELSARQLSATMLAGLIRGHPAASPLRLIVIDEAQRLSRACLSVLEDHADAVKQVACVVLVADEDLEPAHPVSALKAHATIESFVSQPRGARPGLASGQTPRTHGFALVEAIARRDVGAALRAMQEQLAEGKEVVELIGLLGWQLQRWLTVKQLVEAGVSRQRITEVLSLQSWQLERTITEVTGRPMAFLKRMVQRCWAVDVEAKTGRTIPRMALEQLVVELCLPPRRARAVA